MPLLLHHSIHTGRYRLARRPSWQKPHIASAWAKVAAAFPDEKSVVCFWALVDALDGVAADGSRSQRHKLLGYFIRHGLLERS